MYLINKFSLIAIVLNLMFSSNLLSQTATNEITQQNSEAKTNQPAASNKTQTSNSNYSTIDTSVCTSADPSKCMEDVVQETAQSREKAKEQQKKIAKQIQEKTNANVSIDSYPSFIKDSKCLKKSDQECSTQTYGPITNEDFKNIVNVIPFIIKGSSSGVFNSADESVKKVINVCKCIIDTEPDLMSEDETKILNKLKYNKLGLTFANNLAIFKEQYSFYESLSPSEWQKLGKKDVNIPKCDLAQAIEKAKGCNGGDFDKNLEEFLAVTGKSNSKKYPENLNALLYSIENFDDGKNVYTRKKYDAVTKALQTGLDKSVAVDCILTSMLSSKKREELFKDVKSKEDLLSKILDFKKNSKDELKKDLNKKLSKKNSTLSPEKLEKYLNLSDQDFLDFLATGIHSFPVYDSILVDPELRNKLFEEFDDSFKTFGKKFSNSDQKASTLPTLSGFLDWQGETIVDGISSSCEKLKAEINNAFCENLDEFNISKGEILNYLNSSKVDSSKMTGGFAKTFCRAPSTTGQGTEDISDFFRCNNISTNFYIQQQELVQTEKFCDLKNVGGIDPNSEVGQDLSNILKHSNYDPGQEVLKDIFGDTYTKYFSNSDLPSSERNSNYSGLIDPNNTKDLPPVEYAAPVVPPYYPTTTSNTKISEANNGESIEDSQRVSAARKEISDYFKDTSDPDIKKHISNLDDDQVIKLQNELQKIREKYAADMANLKNQVDVLTQKKEFDAKYDKLQKEYDALKQGIDRNPSSAYANSAYSKNSAANFNNQGSSWQSVGKSSFGKDSQGTSFTQSDNTSSSANLGKYQGVSLASQGVESRRVNLTYETNNTKDQKKSGLLVLEVSEVVTGDPIEMANKDLEKYLSQNETKLDNEKLALIASSGVLYRYKGANNEILEEQIPYSVIDPKVKSTIEYMMKSKKVEREMKEVSYAYLLNIIDQYGKK